jgi:predicted small secreted protein
MNRSKPLVALALVAFAFGLAACEKKEGPMERAGKSVDNAAAKVGDKVEKAGDKIQDAVKK